MIAPFEYHAPASLDAALELLARYGEGAHAIAGGCSSVLLMRQGLIRPDHVVGLRRVASLRGISRSAGGELRIGAGTTHREVELSGDVRRHCSALADAFAWIGTVRIRNQGTVGGNLAHADPAQDPPPMLLALDATLDLASVSGERRVPLDGFFTDVFETALGPGELITSVRVPPMPAGARAAYVKFLPRSQDDYATASVAAVVATDEAGVCTHARIAVGAAGPVPFRAREAEGVLIGRRLDDGALAEAGDTAARAADPIDDLRGSRDYKRHMVRVWTSRALAATRPSS